MCRTVVNKQQNFSLYCSSMSQLISQFLKIPDVIQAFLLAWYLIGKLSILIPLKHRGLVLFPITKSFRLSVPDIFEQHNTVTRSIAFLNWTVYRVYSIESRPAWHDNRGRFHRHCRRHPHKNSAVK